MMECLVGEISDLQRKLGIFRRVFKGLNDGDQCIGRIPLLLLPLGKEGFAFDKCGVKLDGLNLLPLLGSLASLLRVIVSGRRGEE